MPPKIDQFCAYGFITVTCFGCWYLHADALFYEFSKILWDSNNCFKDWRIKPTACFISSGDSLIFQCIFCFAHCTDEDQKSETIVCSWTHKESHDKLSLNFKKKMLFVPKCVGTRTRILKTTITLFSAVPWPRVYKHSFRTPNVPSRRCFSLLAPTVQLPYSVFVWKLRWYSVAPNLLMTYTCI